MPAHKRRLKSKPPRRRLLRQSPRLRRRLQRHAQHHRRQPRHDRRRRRLSHVPLRPRARPVRRRPLAPRHPVRNHRPRASHRSVRNRPLPALHRRRRRQPPRAWRRNAKSASATRNVRGLARRQQPIARNAMLLLKRPRPLRHSARLPQQPRRRRACNSVRNACSSSAKTAPCARCRRRNAPPAVSKSSSSVRNARRSGRACSRMHLLPPPAPSHRRRRACNSARSACCNGVKTAPCALCRRRSAPPGVSRSTSSVRNARRNGRVSSRMRNAPSRRSRTRLWRRMPVLQTPIVTHGATARPASRRRLRVRAASPPRALRMRKPSTAMPMPAPQARTARYAPRLAEWPARRLRAVVRAGVLALCLFRHLPLHVLPERL